MIIKEMCQDWTKFVKENFSEGKYDEYPAASTEDPRERYDDQQLAQINEEINMMRGLLQQLAGVEIKKASDNEYHRRNEKLKLQYPGNPPKNLTSWIHFETPTDYALHRAKEQIEHDLKIMENELKNGVVSYGLNWMTTQVQSLERYITHHLAKK